MIQITGNNESKSLCFIIPRLLEHIYECINLEFAFLCCKEMSGRHPFQK